MIEPKRGEGAVLVSSEALSDDPGWEAIPRNRLVTISADGACVLSAL